MEWSFKEAKSMPEEGVGVAGMDAREGAEAAESRLEQCG